MPSTDRSKRVDATASRLRLIQIDFADEPADVRRGYLSEAIEQAIADIGPAEREPFLRKLMERFPTWAQNVEVAAAAPQAPAPVQSTTDQRELRDPSFLLTRLEELLPALSDGEREGVTERLRQMGIAPQQVGGLPEKPIQDIGDVLNMKKDNLDPARAVDLLVPLLTFVVKLDPLVRRTWGSLAPQSRLQSLTPVAHALRQYVTGSQAISREHVALVVEQLRQLLASMVFALAQPGKFTSSYLSRFSPAKIEDLVKMDGGKWFVSSDARCWDKYRELAGQFLNEGEIEKGLRERIASFIETLVLQKPH
jgi:hypothetical protein